MSEPVVELLETEWAVLSELLGSLEDSEWELATDLPGWSVQDVVAHIVGTERMLAGDPTPDLLSHGDHVRNPIGEANEAWVTSFRSTPPKEMLAEFRRITGQRLDELKSLTPEAWDQVGFTPVGPGPYRRFMEIRVFDCWEHEQDIRRAANRPGHLDGPIAAHSIRQVNDALGYVVGKKAAVPDGSTVVFDITGSLPMILPVFVDGRARILDREPSMRDVTIHLDTETYNALGCGRWSGERAIQEDRVSIVGDQELGRRVLDNMAFTI